MIGDEVNRHGWSDKHLREAGQRCADTYAKIANKKFGIDIPVPVPMEWDLEDKSPKSAGRAHGTMLVEINMILYRDNVEEILNDTIPHEIGHLVQFKVFHQAEFAKRTQGHGAEWQEAMRQMGKDPHKYHNFDVTKAVAHYKSRKKTRKKKDTE